MENYIGHLFGILGISKICDKHILYIARPWCAMNVLNKINLMCSLGDKKNAEE